jgi:hypothetical protein
MDPKGENLAAEQNPQAPPPSDADEFDAAMAEAAAAVDGAPADPAAAPDPPADEGAGTGEPPAPAAQPAAADAPPADGTPSPSGPSQDDIWAKAPPELREAFETERRNAELRIKSVQGRQSASDRELQRARDELAALKQGKQPAAGGDGERQSDGEPSDDRFKALREEYPEIAGPLLDYIGELEGKLKPLEEGVGQVRQDRTEAFIAQQIGVLTEKAPDWQTALADDRFGGWLSEQPRRLQEAFKRNEATIVDGEEAAWVVDQFKSAMGIAPPAPAPTPTPAPQDERRQKQLANGRDFGRAAGPAATDGIPDDFDAAFDAFSARKDKQLAGTRR